MKHHGRYFQMPYATSFVILKGIKMGSSKPSAPSMGVVCCKKTKWRITLKLLPTLRISFRLNVIFTRCLPISEGYPALMPCFETGNTARHRAGLPGHGFLYEKVSHINSCNDGNDTKNGHWIFFRII